MRGSLDAAQVLAALCTERDEVAVVALDCAVSVMTSYAADCGAVAATRLACAELRV